MTISDAINRADSLKPNDYSQEEKVRWLSELDHHIFNEIITTHESDVVPTFTDYTIDTDAETVLLAPAPYDEMYIHWLNSKIDLHNGETVKYNNESAVYNSYYTQYSNFYNRTHKPIGRTIKYF